MPDEKPPRLVEVTSIPVIFADDIGRVAVEGPNVRITYVEYRTIGSERVRMPVLEMIRPIEGVKVGSVQAMIADAIRRYVRPQSKH
jgi:hypothetical protein